MANMLYIQSIGVLLPEEALRSVLVERADINEYEVTADIDGRSVDPLIYNLTGHLTRVTINIDAEALPDMVANDGDTIVSVEIETGTTLVRSPDPIPMSAHPMFLNAIAVLSEEAPESRKEAAEYERRTAVAQKFVNNYRSLASTVTQYHTVIATITDPIGTSADADSLLPVALQQKMQGLVAQSIESQAGVARRNADALREKATRLHDWFSRNLFKPSVEEFTPAKLNQAELGTFCDELFTEHCIKVEIA